VDSAAYIAQAVPAQKPDSVSAGVFWQQHSCAMVLLSIVSRGLEDAASSAEAGGTDAHTSESSSSNGSGGSSSGSGSGSGSNRNRSADTNSVGQGGSFPAAASVASREEQLQAAWALVQALPHAAAALRLLAVPGNSHADLLALSSQCLSLSNTARAAGLVRPISALPAMFAQWIAAAEAGLRLQPLLVQLNWQLSSQPATGGLPSNADHLSRGVL